MRCQKCGTISFDWLKVCGKCGASLAEERDLLGRFIPDNGEISWFQEADPEGSRNTHPGRETQAPPDISKVDVSDLRPENMKEESVDIEETELLRAAEDEEFQKALEKIA